MGSDESHFNVSLIVKDSVVDCTVLASFRLGTKSPMRGVLEAVKDHAR